MRGNVLSFREKGKVVLLGDFNARVGKAADDDDVIGKFGDKCNASGNDWHSASATNNYTYLHWRWWRRPLF